MGEVRKRGKQMPPDEMFVKYPSLKSLSTPSGRASREAWVAVFKARPDVMHQLLADFIKQAYAKQGRVGQRPMPKEEQVDFKALVYGEENDRPLVEILPGLMNETVKEFAHRIHMSRTQAYRVLDGSYHPDVAELRAIANAVNKSPMYFVEYRKAMLLTALSNLFDEWPGVATALYRKYLEVRMEAS